MLHWIAGAATCCLQLESLIAYMACEVQAGSAYHICLRHPGAALFSFSLYVAMKCVSTLAAFHLLAYGLHMHSMTGDRQYMYAGTMSDWHADMVCSLAE